MSEVKELDVTVEMKRMIKAKMTYRQIADEIFTWNDEKKGQRALDMLKGMSDAMVEIKANPSILFNRKKKSALIKKCNLNPLKGMFDGA